MNANYAAQVQHLEVERAGYLEFVPEQIIPHRHSRFISETVLRCHPEGTLLYSEILMSEGSTITVMSGLALMSIHRRSRY